MRRSDARFRRTGARLAGALAFGMAVLLAAADASAQYGNLCQTSAGTCLINPSPVGTGCVCAVPNGSLRGTVLGGGYGAQSLASPFCRTFRGACRISGVAPVGSRCNCYGDPGQIVPP